MIPNCARCHWCEAPKYKDAYKTQLGPYVGVQLIFCGTMSPPTKCSKRQPKSTPTAKNAERERSRVRSLRNAFQSLQSCLPSVPPDTKLSKLDILILATNYIAQLTATLEDNTKFPIPTIADLANPPSRPTQHLKYYHPMKKWPMRSRLYSLTIEGSVPMDQRLDTVSDEPDFNNNDIGEMFNLTPAMFLNQFDEMMVNK